MKKKTGGFVPILVTSLLFLVMLVVLVVGTGNLAGGTGDEGLRATKDAIERATVLCYATEGFYPPGITYLEEHYGVQIDRSRYEVSYSTFAYNVRPAIVVVPRGSG